MGREIKRVALDFDWPLNKTWQGYLNPHYDACSHCPACNGTGYSPHGRILSDQWYGSVPFDPVAYGSTLFKPWTPGVKENIKRKVRFDEKSIAWYTRNGKLTMSDAVQIEIHRMLVFWNSRWSNHLSQLDVNALWEENRLRDFTEKPTVQQVNLWSLFGLAHDSINRWICVKARCKRDGQDYTCRVCQGHGDKWTSESAKQTADEWTPTEPPAGEGWQIWETVSEGSPISPVFATPEALAQHMANARPWGAARPMPAADWLKWITGPGWAASAVAVDGVLKDGVQAEVEFIREQEQTNVR
jgi:hypothetical protein